MGTSETLGVLAEIAAERVRQDARWGEANYPDVDEALLSRPGTTPEMLCDAYEVPTEHRAKQLCETAAELGECTFAHVLIEEVCEAIAARVAGGERALRDELIQVAAVCVKWIEAIDRRASRAAP